MLRLCGIQAVSSQRAGEKKSSQSDQEIHDQENWDILAGLHTEQDFRLGQQEIALVQTGNVHWVIW